MEHRAEIRIALESRPLPIPYGQSKREDGENFGYRSVVKEPNAIDQIPELNGEAGMREFFRRLNDPTGLFESVRMVHWLNGADEHFERCLSFGVVFRDRRLFAGYPNCLMFAGNLLDQMCKGTILCDAPFLLEIQPATFLEEHVDGWVIDMYVSGIGNTESAARQRLDQVLESLIPFFQNGGVH